MHFLKSIVFASLIHSILAIPLYEIHLDQIKETQPRFVKRQDLDVNIDILQLQQEEVFPEFENEEANEFFENLLQEEEEAEIRQIEIKEEEEHAHNHIPIEPNMPWHRVGGGKFYQETRLKDQTLKEETKHDDTLKFGFLFLGSLFIYGLLKYHSNGASSSENWTDDIVSLNKDIHM